jgi:signal transduction histidine kinase
VVVILPVLLPDLIVFAAVLILAFAFQSVPVAVAAPVWFVGLVSLPALLATLLVPSFPVLALAPEVRQSWEVWRSALLALGAVHWLGSTGRARPAAVRDVPWLASPVPGLAALVALALATILTPVSPWPALGVLLLLVARESLVNARRRTLVWRMQAALVVEQQVRQREVALERDRVLTLARLFHDQAGPLNGLWFVSCLLAEAKLHQLSAKMEAHLNVLQSLSDNLRRKLTGQQSEASRSRNEDITKFDVRPIVDEAVEAAKARYPKKELPLDVAPYPDDALVMGHAIALRRILDNLITNALDAIPSGGRVSVQVWHDWQHRGSLTITVRDSGPGLTAEEQARAFDSQTPLRVPLTGGRGMGLGLSIVRELAESMGACYGVESTPGEGCRFWIRLPRP